MLILVITDINHTQNVLDDHIPHKLNGHFDENEIYYYHLQSGGMRVGALSAQDIEDLPQDTLRDDAKYKTVRDWV